MTKNRKIKKQNKFLKSHVNSDEKTLGQWAFHDANLKKTYVSYQKIAIIHTSSLDSSVIFELIDPKHRRTSPPLRFTYPYHIHITIRHTTHTRRTHRAHVAQHTERPEHSQTSPHYNRHTHTIKHVQRQTDRDWQRQTDSDKTHAALSSQWKWSVKQAFSLLYIWDLYYEWQYNKLFHLLIHMHFRILQRSSSEIYVIISLGTRIHLTYERINDMRFSSLFWSREKSCCDRNEIHFSFIFTWEFCSWWFRSETPILSRESCVAPINFRIWQ